MADVNSIAREPGAATIVVARAPAPTSATELRTSSGPLVQLVATGRHLDDVLDRSEISYVAESAARIDGQLPPSGLSQ